MQPHTELCAFVCKPKKGEGERIINCQLITDPDILRLWTEVEEADFQCKIVYDRRDALDGWWWEVKLGMVKEWMQEQGCPEWFDAVALCMRKMEVPMLARALETDLSSLKAISVKPTEKFVKLVDTIERDAVQGMMKPLPAAKKKRNEKDDTQIDMLGEFDG